jgi:hypothetical protein
MVMTRDEIIKLAQEVGLDKTGTWWAGHPLQFEDFANLVAAAERKACATLVKPAGNRPCDCDFCDCGNRDDAALVALWDMQEALAKAILERQD